MAYLGNQRTGGFVAVVTACASLLILTCVPAKADEESTPGHTWVALQEFAGRVERLRKFMGTEIGRPLTLTVSNAQPHDVYFQAKSMYDKTARLAFEHLRLITPEPQDPTGVFRPADVLRQVQAADGVLLQLLENYGLDAEQESTSNRVIPNKTPSEIFQQIRVLSRQLGLMLDQQVQPSDVYMELTLAVGYASNMLAAYPEAQRIPLEPPLLANKTPRDVFLLAIDCLRKIEEIYQNLGFESFDSTLDLKADTRVLPMDVNDMAALIVARLDFLQEHLSGIEKPLPAFYPGRKFPSDSFQRGGLLLLQLDSLASFTAKDKLPKP